MGTDFYYYSDGTDNSVYCCNCLQIGLEKSGYTLINECNYCADITNPTDPSYCSTCQELINALADNELREIQTWDEFDSYPVCDLCLEECEVVHIRYNGISRYY